MIEGGMNKESCKMRKNKKKKKKQEKSVLFQRGFVDAAGWL